MGSRERKRTARVSGSITLIVWVNSMPMRFWSRHGSGKSWTWPAFLSELWILRRLSNCKEAMDEETQPKWISFPVATKSLLSLWPHVIDETGNCKIKHKGQNCFFYNFVRFYVPFHKGSWHGTQAGRGHCKIGGRWCNGWYGWTWPRTPSSCRPRPATPRYWSSPRSNFESQYLIPEKSLLVSKMLSNHAYWAF